MTREHIAVTFGRNVKRRRLKLGLSIRQLAAELGWAPARVTEIEQARRVVSPDPGRPPRSGVSLERVQELAAALDCSVASLFRVAP